MSPRSKHWNVVVAAKQHAAAWPGPVQQVRPRGLHDLDERLVERAAPQGNEHALGGVEDPRARPTRILRSARRVQLTLPPAVYSYPITYHITCGINYIFY